MQAVLPHGVEKTSILIEGDRIASVDAAIHTVADEVIEGEGYHLLPGIVDSHVHFREPGSTHKEDLSSGSMACAKGGVTTFVEMPNTSPPAINEERIEEKRRLAAEKSLVNYSFYIGASTDNLSQLRNADPGRTPGIKIFIGSSTGSLLVDDQETLERIFAETTLPICAHCEDEATVRANAAALDGGKTHADHSRIRDHEAALICTKRTFDLARRHNHRFHLLHVSTAQEAELAREHGGLITAEVCPHHLFFNIEDYDQMGSLVQMNPSVKTAADNEALWQALASGWIQALVTDHAPHLLSEKDQPYPQSPSGVPAVENSLALMLDAVNCGRLTLPQVAASMADAPARIWDMVGKGRIAVGYDADLVLVDMNRQHTIRNEQQFTRARWSPWNGRTLTGQPVRTWVLGQTVFQEGMINPLARGREVRYDHGRGGYWGTEAS